ncbi:hypothetical protein JHK84_028349 [Glycine max]|nr:hypothetical protein JHK85_028762 [Glycine max]KAG5004083.1 hypothetical protein JHK86_028222 [Glycine max]KAG5151877.1 hypothetical protein JHK84_028349 [Glycine max]
MNGHDFSFSHDPDCSSSVLVIRLRKRAFRLSANGCIYDGCPKCNKIDDGEATAESDPALPGSITLVKHILPLSHSQVDGIPFEDLSSIQLSSTRLGKKHIKTK